MSAPSQPVPHSPEPPRANAITKATGRPWQQWATWLQESGADGLEHSALAELVLGELRGGSFAEVSNKEWWAQGIAISYEQFVGRRIPGQRSDGSFEATASKTVPLPRAQAWELLQQRLAERTEFLGSALSRVRTSNTDKRDYWRASCAPEAKLQLSLEAKEAQKTLVTGTSTNLISPEAREEHKQAWRRLLEEIFDARKP